MKQEKITCDLCRLDFYAHTITYHGDLAYCYMCDFQFMVDQMAEESTVWMPSYFISKNHYHNFEYLFTQVYSKCADPFDYRLAAYINGLPAIFNIYPKQYPIFIKFPFLWQFNWRIFHILKNSYEKYYIDIDREIEKEKNCIVNKLNKEYQLILESGYLLSQTDSLQYHGFLTVEEYKKHVSNQLSISGQRILKEIFKIHFTSKEGL